MDGKIEELSLRKEDARSKCKKYLPIVRKLEGLLMHYRLLYNKAKKELEEADRALAMIDGRIEILPPALEPRRRHRKIPKVDLSQKDILSLLKEIEEEEAEKRIIK